MYERKIQMPILSEIFYDEVDELWCYRCKLCNAEINGISAQQVQDNIVVHEQVVQCIKGY